jgi:hypothetical protein
MQSNIWGRHAWEFAHTITFNYPAQPTKTDQNNIKGFFDYFGPNLPCSICRESFNYFYEHIPIDEFVGSRYGVVYWLYIMHSLVNYKLNKRNITYSELIYKYENIRVSNEAQTVTANYVRHFINESNRVYSDIIKEKISNLLQHGYKKKDIINIINHLPS